MEVRNVDTKNIHRKFAMTSGEAKISNSGRAGDVAQNGLHSWFGKEFGNNRPFRWTEAVRGEAKGKQREKGGRHKANDTSEEGNGEAHYHYNSGSPSCEQ